MNRFARIVVLFWIFGLLNVQCVVDTKTGDVTCHLTTLGGKKVDCEQGDEIDNVTKNDLRPSTDVVCRTNVLGW